MTHLVRRIGRDEWRELRGIRLEAMRDSPAAFHSSYADAAAYADGVWQEKAVDEAISKSSATFIACDENGVWVGMASVGLLVEVPDHAHIHGVYVSPAHRGSSGIAGRLMDAAIRFAQDHIDVLWLTLGVQESNARALAFYRRIGFEMTGKVIPNRLNPAEKCYIMGYSAFKARRTPVR